MMHRAIRFAPVGKNPCISWAHGPAHSLCKWPALCKWPLGKTLFSKPADDLRIICTRTSIDFALARACARTRDGGGEKLTTFRHAEGDNVGRRAISGLR